MKKFRIHFQDGTHVDKDADDGTVAKRAAKAERVRDTGATDRTDARVKVARVEELGGQ